MFDCLNKNKNIKSFSETCRGLQFRYLIFNLRDLDIQFFKSSFQFNQTN